MNRRSFFGRALGAIAAVYAGSKVTAAPSKPTTVTVTLDGQKIAEKLVYVGPVPSRGHVEVALNNEQDLNCRLVAGDIVHAGDRLKMRWNEHGLARVHKLTPR